MKHTPVTSTTPTTVSPLLPMELSTAQPHEEEKGSAYEHWNEQQ
ncbi:hypothetical protein EGR_10918 [Echinococcus granulosus]|uniref:Uncharacterized protein n=1 Tax=Echinococcus granulosus TaxID=6210 RepID=W6U783_ECHGR|nr:hypothetical protein EGR_10918 [Echinococcus granulosus]EUB54227.1 hypothetical protein EGR_10918 [Echinococcus granulosus]